MTLRPDAHPPKDPPMLVRYGLMEALDGEGFRVSDEHRCLANDPGVQLRAREGAQRPTRPAAATPGSAASHLSQPSVEVHRSMQHGENSDLVTRHVVHEPITIDE